MGEEEVIYNPNTCWKGNCRRHSSTVPLWPNALAGSPWDTVSYIWCLKDGPHTAGRKFVKCL